jgi:hypothetical protein
MKKKPLLPKKTFLLMFLLLAVVVGQAQDKFSHWSMGLSAGPAFPVGGYADKSSTVGLGSGAGHAKTGFSAEIYGLYRFDRHFGAALLAGGQENAIGSPANQLLNPGFNGIVTHNYNWKIGRILGGAVFDQPLSAQGRFSLRVRLLAGMLKTGIPGYSYTLYGLGNGTTIGGGKASNIAMPWAFAYQADAGLTYKLSRGLSLVANTGYAGASPALTYHYMILDNNNNYVSGSEKRKAPTGTVHLQVGVELAL